MVQSPQEQTQFLLPVPSDVERAAQSAQLGRPQKHYWPSLLAAFKFIMNIGKLLLYISLGYLLVVIILYHDNLLRKLYEYLLIWLLIACGLLILTFLVSPLILLKYVLRVTWGIYVYDEGFVYKRGRCATAWRWDQITALWREVKQEIRVVATSDGPIDYMETKRVYILKMQDGKTINLDLALVRMQELLELLDEQIKSCLLPQVIAAFEAGDTVTFGDLRINREEVSWEGNTILWIEIRTMTLIETTLVIEKLDKKKAYWQLMAMPNIGLFQGLKDYIFQRYQGVSGPEG